MAGNKHDNGVHEVGTDEIRNAYQEDTPGQAVEKYIEDRNKAYHEEAKEKKKKHFETTRRQTSLLNDEQENCCQLLEYTVRQL